MTTAGNLRKGG
ncbi:hypothetical protein YPPY64_1345, partial [Yersinia pestis PY-64]